MDETKIVTGLLLALVVFLLALYQRAIQPKPEKDEPHAPDYW